MRKYSLSEIDRMRAAIPIPHVSWFTGMWGLPDYECPAYVNVFTPANLEELLRTYMMAGVGPEELENKYAEKLGQANDEVARITEKRRFEREAASLRKLFTP